MTPPRCLECGASVKRQKPGRYVSEQFGLRIVDGLRWAWFCGQRCSGRYKGRHSDQTGNLLKAQRRMVANAERRVIERVVAALKPVMDAEGKAPVVAITKAVVAEYRRARDLAKVRRWRQRVRDAA